MLSQNALGMLRVKIDADIKTMSGGFTSASKQISSFGRVVPGLLKGATMAIVGVGAAITAVAAAATALAVKGVKDYATYGQGMATVSTMIRENVEANTEAISYSIRQLSLDIPQSTDVMTSAMYDILSASVPVAESMNMLQESGEAAIGGFSDIQTSANLATSTINALGLAFSDADDVFDTAFATVQSGKITFSELASSLGDVLPSAKAMNSGIVEVYGSIAFLTKNAFSADMASISLARTLDALGKKSDKLENMGVRVFGEEGQYVGLVRVIEQIAQMLDGLTDKERTNILEEMGFEVRAARAIVTMSMNLDAFRTTMDDVANSAGASAEAFGRMKDTLVNQWKVLKNSFGNLSIAIGTGFADIAGKGISRIKELVDGIANFIDAGGGLVNLWENHSDLVVAIFKDMSVETLSVIGVMMGNMGKIMVAGAKLAWQPIKHNTFSILRDMRDGLLLYIADLGLAITKNREWYEKQIVEIVNMSNKEQRESTAANLESMDTLMKGFLSTIKTTYSEGTKAAGGFVDSATASLRAAANEMNMTVTKGVVVVKAAEEEKIGFVEVAQEIVTETVSKGLAERMAALQEKFREEELEFFKKAEKNKEAEREFFDQNLKDFEQWMYDRQVGLLQDQKRWDERMFDLEKRDQESMEKRVTAQKEADEKMYKESEEGLREWIAVEKALNQKSYENALTFQAMELNSFQAQQTLILAEYDERLNQFKAFGLDTIELERWKNEQIRELQAQHWTDYANNVSAGIGNLADAYGGIYDLFHDGEMSQEEFQGKWIVKMANWVDDQAQLLGNLISIWKDAISIISTVAGWIGGDGGGGGVLSLASAAGNAAGNVGVLAKAGAGLSAVLGKIGAAASTAGSYIASVASAAAAAVPVVASFAALAAPIGLLAWTGYELSKGTDPRPFFADEYSGSGARQRESKEERKRQESGAGYGGGIYTAIERQMIGMAESFGISTAEMRLLLAAFDDAEEIMRFLGVEVLSLSDQFGANLSASLSEVTGKIGLMQMGIGGLHEGLTNITGSAFRLSDELVGHSLTTALGLTAKEMQRVAEQAGVTGTAVKDMSNEVRRYGKAWRESQPEEQAGIEDSIAREETVYSAQLKFRAEQLGDPKAIEELFLYQLKKQQETYLKMGIAAENLSIWHDKEISNRKAFILQAEKAAKEEEKARIVAMWKLTEKEQVERLKLAEKNRAVFMKEQQRIAKLAKEHEAARAADMRALERVRTETQKLYYGRLKFYATQMQNQGAVKKLHDYQIAQQMKAYREMGVAATDLARWAREQQMPVSAGEVGTGGGTTGGATGNQSPINIHIGTLIADDYSVNQLAETIAQYFRDRGYI